MRQFWHIFITFSMQTILLIVFILHLTHCYSLLIFLCMVVTIKPNEPLSWQNLFLPYANNKGVDQPAHPHSLICTYVVRCLDSIIHILVTSKISSLASLCSWAGRFVSYMVANFKDRFSCDMAHIIWKWARAWKNKQNDLCAQQRLRSPGNLPMLCA